MGWDGWDSLLAAAKAGWQRHLWAAEPRVPAADSDLVGPPRRELCLEEHRRWLAAAPHPKAPERRTALAAGLEGRALAYLRAKEEGAWDKRNPPAPFPCS